MASPRNLSSRPISPAQAGAIRAAETTRLSRIAVPAQRSSSRSDARNIRMTDVNHDLHGKGTSSSPHWRSRCLPSRFYPVAQVGKRTRNASTTTGTGVEKGLLPQESAPLFFVPGSAQHDNLLCRQLITATSEPATCGISRTADYSYCPDFRRCTSSGVRKRQAPRLSRFLVRPA